MKAHSSQETVVIVLCTYNGEKHLEEQLDSIAAQTWPVAVRVFDDASTDRTIDILKQFKDKLDLSISTRTTNVGYVRNFELGIAAVLSEGFDYIALSDQDDIWHPHRIAEGVTAVQAVESKYTNKAAVLAHSDLRMIDANKQCVHQSFLSYRHYKISKTRNLATVLGQNGVMGNTTLMNRSLASMAQPFPKDLHVHDYWLAVLAELHGHRVFLDKALVDYRIHSGNASNSIGNTKFGRSRVLENKSWGGFIKRDFRLPFMEDSRIRTVDALLEQPSRFPKISTDQTHLLTVFRDYLSLEGSRYKLVTSMLRAGFFRVGLRHRTRVVFSTLFTKRYND